MSKLIYRCDNCSEKVVKDINFKMSAEELDGFINNFMNINGFYPEIERFVVHNCFDGTKGIARLSGIKVD